MMALAPGDESAWAPPRSAQAQGLLTFKERSPDRLGPVCASDVDDAVVRSFYHEPMLLLRTPM